MPEAAPSTPPALPSLALTCLSPILGTDRARRLVRRGYAIGYLVYFSIRAQYARAILGILWAVLTPLLFLAVYVPLFTYVFNVNPNSMGAGADDTLAFPLYVVTGFLAWLAFQEGVSNGAGSLVYNLGVVRHSPSPPATLPLVKVVSSFVAMGIGLAFLLAFLTATGRFPGIRLVLVPVAVVLLFAFTWGLSLLLSSLATQIRDVLQMLNTLLLVEFFACPLIYHVDMVPEHLHGYITFNPLTPFLNLLRAGFLPQQPIAYQDVWLACGWTGLAMLVGVTVFRRLEPSFADQS